jgi:two-component system chemotaxis response regulator CheB
VSIRVLVVDDSRFFRRRVTEMLESDPRIKVIADAENGEDAVQKAGRLKPDVITMDVEMPVMDGITAVRKIMATHPTAILMFSSLTTEGARSTLDALEAGAADYLPKRFEDISKDRDEARKVLCDRVCAVGRRRAATMIHARPNAPRPATPRSGLAGSGAAGAQPKAVVSSERPASSVSLKKGQAKLVAIGTSTGGPVALQQVLKQLPASFPVPLLLVQHMPGTFTTAFAQRLNDACAIRVKEAQDGDALEAGLALLAPGGKQMMLERAGGRLVVRIKESDITQNYKPSVDITFGSVARTLGGQALAIVLTGMGADGREGARLMKKSGSHIWAQDEATSVVYGMPSAVAEAGLVDQVLPLGQIGITLAQRI